jgi:hypothetical protein
VLHDNFNPILKFLDRHSEPAAVAAKQRQRFAAKIFQSGNEESRAASVNPTRSA